MAARTAKTIMHVRIHGNVTAAPQASHAFAPSGSGAPHREQVSCGMGWVADRLA